MRASWIALVFLAACGDSGGTVVVDSPAMPDAPYDTARCLIQGYYGDAGAKVGTTSQGPTTSTIVVDPGPPRDVVFLKLNAGKGVFAAGLANGTFTLAGAELGSTTCGACVNIVADITGTGPTKFYFATGGSVTLTQTSPPAGSFANVTFQEVTAAGAMVPGGCDAKITSMSFTTN